jgi:hypothetical protein
VTIAWTKTSIRLRKFSKEAQKLPTETEKKEYENFCSSSILTTFPNSERVLKTPKSTEQIQFHVFWR